MREIEVKYRVHDTQAALTALKSRGVEVSDPLHQDDQAYAPAGWEFGDSKAGVPFLRLRTEAGRHTFTLKQPVQNDQACIEHETEVADRAAIHHAILLMGYQPTVRISKTRWTASMDGAVLCIDDIEGAGSFIEAERMAPDDADAQEIQSGLSALIESLDVADARVTETYDSLVHAARKVSA